MAMEAKPKSLKIALDTTTLDINERVALWHDVGSKLYVQHQPHVPDANLFSARTDFASSSGYDVSIAHMAGITLERSLYHSRVDDSGRCFFCMLLKGSLLFIQDDVEIAPMVCQIFLIDTTRPYRIVFLTPSQLLHFTIPRDELERSLGNIKRYTGVMTSP